MTDAERKAMEWLDWCLTPGNCTPTVVAHVRTLKAMLARPVLPEELSGAEIELLWDAWLRARGDKRDHVMALYRALYAHLTAPKTKEVEVWHVEFADPYGNPGISGPYIHREAAEDIAKTMAWPAHSCIHVTGPHKQTVPA